MAASDLVPALQTAVEGFNTVVDGKQPTLDAKLPPAQTALDGARVSRDGALVARNTTIASRDAAYRDLRSAQANLDHQDLAALAASKSVNAVDVFIYDTSKDSDGGAWRKRCTRTSWFNEPLNTATRGARREFPAVAVIVTEIDKVTIYDGDDPALPMWMVFEVNNPCMVASSTAPTLTSVVGRNGEVIVGSGYIYGGVSRIQFPADTAYRHRSIPSTNKTQGKWILGGIAARHKDHGFNDDENDAARIINEKINDVAMTVLPDAPIDPATGLPVPTIAVATASGVSVIRDDGAVVDSKNTWAFRNVVIAEDFTLWFSSSSAAYGVHHQSLIGIQEQFGAADNATALAFSYQSQTGYPTPRGGFANDVSRIALGVAIGKGVALSLVHAPEPKSTSPRTISDAMLCEIYSTHAIGWLPGDIRGAFLADTDATDLVGGTDADRSVKNNPLTVNGTIARAPVAPGAELVEYRCGASDWLSQDFAGEYNGQSTFALIFWAKGNPSSQGFRWFETAGGGTSAAYLNLYFDANTGQPRFVWQGRISLNTGGDCPPHTGQWAHHVALFEGGSFKHYQNGVLQSSSVHGVTAELHELRISPVTTAAMALFRITNTIPTADQIRRIYEDEKVLFQENAACTLYGTSDAVTALAHDDDTNLLHVGTSAGRSVFKGLRRVDHTTQPVTTAISAANGMVIEQ